MKAKNLLATAAVLAVGVVTCVVVRSGETKPPGGGPPVKDCEDRVTAGGWILDESDGKDGLERVGFANFGAGGGIHKGELWGHLNYVDHDSDIVRHVKAQEVIGYCTLGEECRKITYFPAEVDGVEGLEVTIVVCDSGEPGVLDEFHISISSLGYAKDGFLGGDQEPSGGNVQLHKPEGDCEGIVESCD